MVYSRRRRFTRRTKRYRRTRPRFKRARRARTYRRKFRTRGGRYRFNKLKYKATRRSVMEFQMSLSPSANVWFWSAGFALKMTDFPELVNYTKNFDQFRIVYAKMRIIPPWVGSNSLENIAVMNASAVQGGNQIGTPWPTAIRYAWCPDYDDALPPQSFDEIADRGNSKKGMWKGPLTMGCKPAVSMETYKTAVSSAYAPRWRQWLDVQDAATPHYGLKLCAASLQQVAPVAELTYKFRCWIEQTIWVQAKNRLDAVYEPYTTTDLTLPDGYQEDGDNDGFLENGEDAPRFIISDPPSNLVAPTAAPDPAP